jgi:NAD(P)-dependent dehydrogenase (short-subunit alcohol dehydrogenase family)
MRVLVAGSDGGIGAACCALLEREGHSFVGVDRDTHDITVPGGAEAASEHARAKLGGLDGIIHAVGMSGRSLGDGPVTSCTDEAWSEVMRVNLESVFRLLRAGLPALRATGGAFVAIGSVLGASSDPDFLTAAYAASKAGMEGLVRTAAMELAPDGVRVNLLAAGLVDTPMSARANGDPVIAARLRDLQPLGRVAVSPETVADAVYWLLSAASARTTGATIPVDGGWLLR